MNVSDGIWRVEWCQWVEVRLSIPNRCLQEEYKIIKYTKIIKSFLGEGDVGRSVFYVSSNFGYDGVPEFTACRGTVCTVEWRVSCFNGCVFCEVQLRLVSCSWVLLSCPKLSCVQWSVSGCGRSHLGCVSGVLSGIHVLWSFWLRFCSSVHWMWQDSQN